MSCITFVDRQQAGWMLVSRLRERGLSTVTAVRPLVLAIPRGGVEVGAVLAHGLAADLDVVLARKLRASRQPELALGAVSEAGEVYLNHFSAAMTDACESWVEAERCRQMADISRRRALFRAVRPPAPIADRTVIVTDDGMATGATMIAALRTVRAAGPSRIIVALPVAPADRIHAIEPLCDQLECLQQPHDFLAVGQFYRSFDEVSDDRVLELLRDYGSASSRWLERPAATASANEPTLTTESADGHGTGSAQR